MQITTVFRLWPWHPPCNTTHSPTFESTPFYGRDNTIELNKMYHDDKLQTDETRAMYGNVEHASYRPTQT
jgi:hypothetical protein